MKLDAIEVINPFSDTTCLRCLLLLQSEGELCVCEFIRAIGESQPKISRHLAHLRKSGLVVVDGIHSYYKIYFDEITCTKTITC